jgi:beta-lactamase superfamily II metal-dependent hydrolase
LLERRPPRRVYVNDFFGRRGDDPPMVRRLVELLERRDVEIIRVRGGQEVRLGPETRVQVLWPPPAAKATDLDVNDGSLVLRLMCANRSVLIPADVGTAVEEELSKRPTEQIRADVLVLPHHGSLTPTLRSFIDAVGPEILLQSSSYRYEPEEALAALGGRPRYATFRHGWIGLDLTEGPLRPETMRQD